MKKRIISLVIVLTILLSAPFAWADDGVKFQASSWAIGELEKAHREGLIPDILEGVDLTKTISREEFAGLAVRLYEKATGTEADAAAPNPFTDTANAEILKAYKLGITQGTSPTTFSPAVLIDREQCAVMLYRTIKIIAPAGNYSTEGVRDFADQKQISAWAAEGTKYMSKLGIIKGDNGGNFMPKAVTPEQEAAGYGMAAREAAILMSIRSYEQIKAGALGTSGNGTEPVPEEPAALDSTVVGSWILGTVTGAKYNQSTGKYEGGATGLGQEYIFKSDGSYSALVIWSNTIFLSGKYSVKDGVITLTERSALESNDGGSTWGEKEALPDAWAHFIAGTDAEGSYLLIGEEGVEPPLIDKTNARKYRAKQ